MDTAYGVITLGHKSMIVQYLNTDTMRRPYATWKDKVSSFDSSFSLGVI